jgi:hypothetical protein
VVKEDPSNADILYIGTDNGLYVSINKGAHCMLLGDIPAAPVHDLAIHDRDKEIVVATHGRSFYKANVAHLQKLDQDLADAITCFDEKLKVTHRDNWGSRFAVWTEAREPETTFPVFVKSAGEGKLMIYADSLLVHEEKFDLKKGLSYYTYHLDVDEAQADALGALFLKKEPDSKLKMKKADNGKYYLLPGKYKMKVVQGKAEASVQLEIKERK